VSEQRQALALAKYAQPGAPHLATPRRRASVGAGLAPKVVRDISLGRARALAMSGPFVRSESRLSRWACWQPGSDFRPARSLRPRRTLTGAPVVTRQAAARQQEKAGR